MKVVILNKKRVGVTLIIIGLMIMLFGLEKKFEERLRFTALLQSNITSLKQYNGLNSKLSYKLPSNWITKEQKFEGNEIIYHNDFQSPDFKVHGFVQVWNYDKDLLNFLNESKEVSEKQNVYQYYKISKISINKIDGFEVNYRIKTTDDMIYNGYEYFLKDKGKILRFSFFIRNENLKENTSVIFKSIVETLKYSD